MNVNLGSRIKKIRLELGENLEVFGKRFGANRSLVSAWENNRYTPSPKRLKAIAELGGMSAYELISPNITPNFIKNNLNSNDNKILLMIVNEINDIYDFTDDEEAAIDIFNLDIKILDYFRHLYDRLEVEYMLKQSKPTNINEQIKSILEARDKIVYQLSENIQNKLQKIIFNDKFNYEHDSYVNLIVDVINRKSHRYHDFLIVIIEELELLARSYPRCLSFMLQRYLSNPVDEINKLLDNNNDGLRMFHGNKLDKKFIIDSIDYEVYTNIQDKLLELFKYIDDNVKPKEAE